MVLKAKNFLNESYGELKKVQWPDKKTTSRLTIYVIGVSLLVGLFVTAVDFVFKELLAKLIG